MNLPGGAKKKELLNGASNTKIRMFKIPNTPKLRSSRQWRIRLENWGFDHSDLFRISLFEFRILLQNSRFGGLEQNLAGTGEKTRY
jgi:hypothetical protein